ncbi:hypothetical protein KY289_030735 [Solanum tuberosum]|nr:hypothetical protein KY289_030735 [Solanum tuberosum]
MEEHLAAVQRRLGGTYATTLALVPPSTALEVEMLCRPLRWEKKKHIERDRLMGRMWKDIKVIFSFVAPSGSFPRLNQRTFGSCPG